MEELGRWTRDAPPSDFIIKIKSFSTLSASSMEKYESPEFEAAGTKWKLAIYPNGLKARGGKDHISVYLVLADKRCKETSVRFSLFLYNQISKKFLTVDGEVCRFDEVEYKYGYAKFLPLEVFKDVSNGYLINGTCLFGAEVFKIKHTNKFKFLSVSPVKEDAYTFAWKIDKFSKLNKYCYLSELFTVGGYGWKLVLYPRGTGTSRGNSLSVYLFLADSKTGCSQQEEKQVIVEFQLRLMDQFKENHVKRSLTVSFGDPTLSWGSLNFSLTKLIKESNDYLVKDSIKLEADVVVVGSTTNWV